MAWFRVIHADGTTEDVEATSGSEASRMVRSPGEMIKEVREIPAPVTPATTVPATTTPTATKFYLTFPAKNESYEITGVTTKAEAEKVAKGWGVGGIVTTEPAGRVLTAPTEEKPAEYTDEQWQDYYDYLAFLASGNYPNLPTFDNIADFLAGRDDLIANWDFYISVPETPPTEPTTPITPTIPTAEVETERYMPSPMYSETFAAWLNEQGEFSGALERFVESQYPSLQARFEAGVGHVPGVATREEERATETQLERGFEAWLEKQVPELEQKYYGQTPSMRGERYYMYAPTTREVNW